MYSREELLSICQAALIPEKDWRHRFSGNAQRQVGELWALLSSGCEFEIVESDPAGGPVTDDRRIIVRVIFASSDSLKVCQENSVTEYQNPDIYFLPHPDRLGNADWYM